MADEHKSIALVILGVVAVIAIVGLVLLFTQNKSDSTTGQGIYGGAMKNVEYPNWAGRGVPRAGISDSRSTYTPGQTESNDMSSSWNFYGNPKRNPLGDVPSPMTACGSGSFMISMDNDQVPYYASRGYYIVELDGTKGAYACVYPQGAMTGGIAGQN